AADAGGRSPPVAVRSMEGLEVFFTGEPSVVTKLLIQVHIHIAIAALVHLCLKRQVSQIGRQTFDVLLGTPEVKVVVPVGSGRIRGQVEWSALKDERHGVRYVRYEARHFIEPVRFQQLDWRQEAV